jgi:hypothetical protein
VSDSEEAFLEEKRIRIDHDDLVCRFDEEPGILPLAGGAVKYFERCLISGFVRMEGISLLMERINKLILYHEYIDIMAWIIYSISENWRCILCRVRSCVSSIY